jgi:hypothetical protein
MQAGGIAVSAKAAPGATQSGAFFNIPFELIIVQDQIRSRIDQAGVVLCIFPPGMIRIAQSGSSRGAAYTRRTMWLSRNGYGVP